MKFEIACAVTLEASFLPKGKYKYIDLPLASHLSIHTFLSWKEKDASDYVVQMNWPTLCSEALLEKLDGIELYNYSQKKMCVAISIVMKCAKFKVEMWLHE